MSTHFKNRRGGWPATGNDSGFSLISVLTAIGIIGIAIMGIGKGVSFAKRAQNDVAIKLSANKFQDSIRGEVSKVARKFVLDRCTGERWGKTSQQSSNSSPGLSVSNGGNSSGNPSLSSKLAVNYAFESVPLIPGVSLGFTNSPVAKAATHQAAANRCKNPKDLATIGDGQYSYFCMNFNVDASVRTSADVSNQSFWKLENPFMEIMLIPVNLKTDVPIMCQDSASPGSGIKILYSVHYASKTGDKQNGNDVYLGKTMNNIFYVRTAASQSVASAPTQYTSEAACCSVSGSQCTKCMPADGSSYWVTGQSSCGGSSHTLIACSVVIQ